MRFPHLILSTLSLTALATAQVVASDSFNYSGALTANGWTAHSGAGSVPVLANGAEATLTHGAGSREDVTLPFTVLSATDTIFASFRFRVPSGTPVNPDGQGLYFAHFKDAGTAFRARTGFLSPAAGGDFGLAIHADSADLGLGVAWPTDLSFDTWYSVVISWDAATGRSELWLDPTCTSMPSITHTGTLTGTLIAGFALRQSNDYTGQFDIDDVVVGRTFGDVLPGTGTFAVSCTSCPGLTQVASGSPNIGGNVRYDVAGANAVMVGFVSTCTPICAIGCNMGSDWTVLSGGSQLNLSIPCLPILVGASIFTQGVSIGSGGCPASVFGVEVGTSDTIQTTIGG